MCQAAEDALSGQLIWVYANSDELLLVYTYKLNWEAVLIVTTQKKLNKGTKVQPEYATDSLLLMQMFDWLFFYSQAEQAKYTGKQVTEQQFCSQYLMC
jgi:hypothetical protein